MMADNRPEMFGLLGGFRGWPVQWNHAKCCGPSLVAMATKFGLGAEIQSPAGLSCKVLQQFSTVHFSRTQPNRE